MRVYVVGDEKINKRNKALVKAERSSSFSTENMSQKRVPVDGHKSG